MNIQRLTISSIAVGFFMWAIAGIWHKLILANFYTNAVEAEHKGIGILLLSYCILALLMAILYTPYHKVERPLRSGLVFGIIIGLIWVFPHGLAMAGAHGEPLDYVIKNALWHVIEQGLGGILLGWLFSIKSS